VNPFQGCFADTLKRIECQAGLGGYGPDRYFTIFAGRLGPTQFVECAAKQRNLLIHG
jgi:hypothetical protein